MKSNVWGPYAWLTLHIVPLAAAAKDPHQKCSYASEWLRSLHKSIPCSECQQHYSWNLQENPPPKNPTAMELSDYICRLHNHVASSTGNPTWTCQQVYDFYGFDSTNPSQSRLSFWSRNWLVFIYLAIHSPQVDWNEMKTFMQITGQQLPWASPQEENLWNDMMRALPDLRCEAFAWFEEFKPKWSALWNQTNPWPQALTDSPYLKRMRWVLCALDRNPSPATGVWVSFS